MKTEENKKKLGLKKTTIAQLNKKSINEIKETQRLIKGGAEPTETTLSGSTCYINN